MQPAAEKDVVVKAAPSSGVRKPRKSRGKGLRTTTGCAVCRRRHMKCDEVKPTCGACAKGNRACVYGCVLDDEPNGNDQSPPSNLAPYKPPTASQPRTFTSESGPQNVHHSPWATPRSVEEAALNTSPQGSNLGTSTGYGTEVAPLRWFGLLAGDAANGRLGFESPTGNTGSPPRDSLHAEHLPPRELPTSQPGLSGLGDVALQNPSKLLQISAISPAPLNGAATHGDEREYWQAAEPIQLKDHELDMFEHYVTSLAQWIDLFDPLRHMSSLVPHLALYNEGLMKAVLALGARHLSIKPNKASETSIDRTAAVQYYYETLQYLQNAMRFTSYKNSQELLATTLVVSTYEMIDGAGQGWERHLKGVFWIQRSRDLNGESGGLEQAIWWAWLRQDMWAAFREHRRCFSFYKPTKPYHQMSIWDMASRVVYILAQSVNYASDEEKKTGESDLSGRILRANALLNMLDEWRSNVSIHFGPLPTNAESTGPLQPLWVHPPAFGVSLQLHSMARILLLIHQPAAGGYLEYLGRDKIINQSIDTIGGIAIKLADDASRLMSTQALFAAGLYCHDPVKQQQIAHLIEESQSHTGWPSNTNLADELRAEWSRQKPR